MAAYGYGNVPDRGFLSFERELGEGAWKQISTKKFDDCAGNVAKLVEAPRTVEWKLRLKWGISALVEALGAQTLAALDVAWDGAQRRLYHRIAIGVDDDNLEVREAADRLRAQLLLGTGTQQTQLDLDGEVDFGRKQLALAGEGGPLAADAKKAKIGDALAAVEKTTEALAKGLGRAAGLRRKTPAKQIRGAIAGCVATFNAVHDHIAWFVANTPPGPEREHLAALLKPLDDLLARHTPVATGAPSVDETAPTDPAPAPAPAPAGNGSPA